MYKVLLDDDEKSVLDILQTSVGWQELGVDAVLKAQDGREALALFEQQSESGECGRNTEG